MRTRLPYKLRELIAVVFTGAVCALPPCITALRILPKIEFPEPEPIEKQVEEAPETVLTAGMIIALVMVGIVVAVTMWKTVFKFLRKHASVSIGFGGILLMWGLLKIINQYQVVIKPLSEVFEVWVISSAAAVVAYLAASIVLEVGWRSKEKNGVRADTERTDEQPRDEEEAVG